MKTLLTRIVSGGQTGVDRAALDVALELGLSCGGWCPRGRRAEDGTIPDRYPLTETSSAGYPQRTRCNVLDSDGTLLVTRGRPTGGTALTMKIVSATSKPHCVVDLSQQPDPDRVRAWCLAQQLRVLNVAGPRESECPGIYEQAAEFLRAVLA
jgi:Circularly permutated YpsA SLOG family